LLLGAHFNYHREVSAAGKFGSQNFGWVLFPFHRIIDELRPIIIITNNNNNNNKQENANNLSFVIPGSRVFEQFPVQLNLTDS